MSKNWLFPGFILSYQRVSGIESLHRLPKSHGLPLASNEIGMSLQFRSIDYHCFLPKKGASTAHVPFHQFLEPIFPGRISGIAWDSHQLLVLVSMQYMYLPHVYHIWGFHGISIVMGVPPNGWFIMENTMKMDDPWVPLSQKTSENLHMLVYSKPMSRTWAFNGVVVCLPANKCSIIAECPDVHIDDFTQTVWENHLICPEAD